MTTQQQALQYSYAMRAPRYIGGLNRVGQKCAVIVNRRIPKYLSQIQFEDGTQSIVTRMVLRRLPVSAIVDEASACEPQHHGQGN